MLKDFLDTLPQTNKPVVCVLSGGLDSTILLYTLVEKYGKDNVYALSFNYKQKQVVELMLASKTCKHLSVNHRILDLSVLGDIAKSVCANIQETDVSMPTIHDVLGDPQPVTYVPYRNMLLNTFAFSFAESVNAQYVFSGLQATDAYGYWDTTTDFIYALNGVSKLNRKCNIELVAPFVNLSKADEIALAKDMNVKFEYTLTCYDPKDGESCGVCPSCSERIAAFKKNGIKDPVKYKTQIDW